MIPVMQPGGDADARKGRSFFWREVRLCSARVAGQSTTLYGATLITWIMPPLAPGTYRRVFFRLAE